jgi:hypothetical protein
MDKLIFSLAFFISFSTSAFTLNNNVGARFKENEVAINVASHSCQFIGVTNDELLSLAEEAVARYWNTVATTRLTLVRGSLVSLSSDFQTGLVCSSSANNNCEVNPALKVSSDILISCNNNTANYSNSVSVLGVTVPNNISGTDIIGSLILINDSSGNAFASKDRDEQIAIISHEIGHAVGLGHTRFDHNLMFYQSISTRRALGRDDVDGITWLYPAGQPFGACGSIELQNDRFPPSAMAGFLLIMIVAGLIRRFLVKKL